MLIDLYDLPKVKNKDVEGIPVEAIKQALSRENYSKFNNWFRGKEL